MLKVWFAGAISALFIILPILPRSEGFLAVPISYASTDPTTAMMPAVTPALPQQLIIPSIGLRAPVVAVGLTPEGNMDVPSGATHNVGWYQGGTVPGSIGSAVLDAHVFAAFSKLNKVKVGSDIYVATSNNTKLHFKVTAMKTYPLAQIPLDQLFNGTGSRSLNLITCAGKYIKSAGTYDHRLIVYTTLVG